MIKIMMKVFCFTCLKASRLGKLKACASKGDDAFLSRGVYELEGCWR